jgi:subtilase family serine protease
MKRSLLVLMSTSLAASGSLFGANLATAASPHPRLEAERVCTDTRLGYMHCLSFVMSLDGKPYAFPTVSGYGPADLQDAYKLPSATRGAGQTVAIVDAFDNPNAEADLQVYRNFFGLPKCTTNNGCFRKIDQRGGKNYPPGNVGWGEEIALDLDMVSAICPLCNILLVEADDSMGKNLYHGVNRAVKEGAVAISNSYGSRRERERELIADEKFFNHPGVAITVASGDSGYGNEMPAASKYVTAVGGTALTHDSNQRGWKETAWSGAGSGCSKYEKKPKWQLDVGCPRRAVADVSAVASPSTGVAVYDTYGVGGWLVFGGTSVSSPIIASVYALAGDKVLYGSRPYMNPGKLFDVTTGTNGTCADRWPYMCAAGPGYDGPTGLGTPNGIGAF